MKLFEVHGTFSAADIEDALLFLRDHFDKVVNGVTSDYDRTISISVRPLSAEALQATRSAEAS